MAPRLVLLVALAGFSGPVFAQCTSTWTLASSGGQNGRWNHAMVYDSARQRVVMYGGENPGVLDEMYFWNATAWVPIVNEDGPGPRAAHAMAYDSARDRIVLFGGRIDSSATISRETWEFDGTSWVLVSSTGPLPRYNAAMAYDAARGRCVLYGGQSPAIGYFSDTWEWNGGSWQVMSPGVGSPGESSAPMMAYDASRSRTVYTDGLSVWEYEGVHWQLVSSAGPFFRIEGAIDYDPVRRKVVIATGGTSVFPSYGVPDTWTWDGSQWECAAACGPGARFGAAMAFDAVLGRHILFGGLTPTSFQPASTWKWDGTVVPFAPAVLTQPSGASVWKGGSVTISAAVAGSAPLGFQWRRNGNPVSDGAGGASAGGGYVSGATTATLHISSINRTDAGQFDLVATNAIGQVITYPAQIQVRFQTGQPCGPGCYPNCDGSNAGPICLTANDFQCFLNLFAAGCADPMNCYANCDGSSLQPFLNANDFQCFLNAFAAGCS